MRYSSTFVVGLLIIYITSIISQPRGYDANLSDCRPIQIPIDANIAQSINPSLWNEQGIYNGTSKSYIWYYTTGLLVDLGLDYNMRQEKFYYQNKYIDFFCFLDEYGNCTNTPMAPTVYFTYLYANSIFSSVPARACTVSTDPSSLITKSIGVEVSPFNWAMNTIYLNGSLYSDESIINKTPDGSERLLRMTTHNLDGTYAIVTYIHQVRIATTWQ